MRKEKKVLTLLLALIMVVSIAAMAVGCGPDGDEEKVLTYTASALADATVGATYSASVATATGEGATIKYALKAGSALPAGLVIDPNGSGAITGTPTASTATAASFTVVASAEGFTDVEAVFSITVKQGSFVYSGGTLSAGRVGEVYSASVSTAAGASAITYELKTGSKLPDGLTLSDSGNGAISGTPTAATDGAHSFTIVASAPEYKDEEQSFSITIQKGTLSYDSASLSGGNIGTAYSATVALATANGSLSPVVTYALKPGSTLPAGLALDQSGSGAITGTPTAATTGAHSFTVVASAGGYEDAETAFSIIIANAGELAYSGSALTATVGTAYSLSIATATGAANITYSVKQGSSLPGWLSLNNGTISGTPTAAASAYSFTLVASATGFTSAEAEFTITVRAGSLSFASATMTSAVKNEAYEANIKATAVGTLSPTITYKIQAGSNPPAGLALSQSGVLSGTPTAAVSGYTFVVVASADNYNDATATFTITVLEQLKSFDFWTVYTDLSNFSGNSWEYMNHYPDYMTIERTGMGNSATTMWDTQGHIADYFLQGVHNTINQELVWRIVSDTETTATLQMSMALEIVKKNVEMYSSTDIDVYGGSHRIVVNGEDIPFGKYSDYDSITFSRASASDPMQFSLYTMAEIKLVEGENIIKFMIGENDWLDGVPGSQAFHGSAPAIELIRLNTTAGLSWTPKLENITNRAALQDGF